MQFPSFAPKGLQVDPPTGQVNIAVTTGIQQLALPAALTQGNIAVARFAVDGTANIAFAWGAPASLTLGNGEFMLANTLEIFAIPAGVTQISVIGSAAGSTLRIMPGEGN